VHGTVRVELVLAGVEAEGRRLVGFLGETVVGGLGAEEVRVGSGAVLGGVPGRPFALLAGPAGDQVVLGGFVVGSELQVGEGVAVDGTDLVSGYLLRLCHGVQGVKRVGVVLGHFQDLAAFVLVLVVQLVDGLHGGVE
jgi:hypothetical protein